jgi:hypothetical protein
MRELLVLVIVVAAIAIIWYLRQERTRAADPRRNDRSRRIAAEAPGAERASAAAGPRSNEAKASAAEAGPAAEGAGLFQDAAGAAAGLPYERAVDQMEKMTANLADARRDAERAAARLADRATEAIEAIQAAAAAHGGAIPGDGTDRCPPRYPVKGSMTSMRYHLPSEPSYNHTVPEVCFQSAPAAEAAGFSVSSDEARIRRDAPLAEGAVVEQIEARPEPDSLQGAAAKDRR